jgi:hypothetical protein
MPRVVAGLIIGAVFAIAWWRIFRRIGWPPWLAVLAVVLPVNLIIPFVLAFSRWPVEDRVASLEREVARLRNVG